MYYRSQGYPYSKNVNLPPNYGGNAFCDNNATKSDAVETIDNETNIAKEETKVESDTSEEEMPFTPPPAPKATHASMFSNNSFLGRKLGSEELLLLAVIFLISGSEGNDDVLWLLIILLFIK